LIEESQNSATDSSAEPAELVVLDSDSTSTGDTENQADAVSDGSNADSDDGSTDHSAAELVLATGGTNIGDSQSDAERDGTNTDYHDDSDAKSSDDLDTGGTLTVVGDSQSDAVNDGTDTDYHDDSSDVESLDAGTNSVETDTDVSDAEVGQVARETPSAGGDIQDFHVGDSSVKKDMRCRDIEIILIKYPQFVYCSGGFLCKTCSAYASPGDRNDSRHKPFISSGSDLGDHPADRLGGHLKTKLHTRCVNNETNVKMILSKGGMEGLYESNYQTNVDKNRKYFATLIKSLDYSIQKYNPKSQLGDFIKFLAYELDEPVTKDFLEKNKGSKYGKYLSAGSIEELLQAYSMWCEDQIHSSLRNAVVCTFFADDSEANNSNDEMIVFMTWIDPQQVLGTLQPYAFLQIKSVAPPLEMTRDGVPPEEPAVVGSRGYFSAKAVYGCMKSVLQKHGVPQDLIKFICFVVLEPRGVCMHERAPHSPT
jgi:hypothetical protein